MSDRVATLLARLGFAARGLVYLLVGWFALDAAMRGTRPGDNQGAIASLADLPFGRVLLIVVALGLAGYAVWRLTEAILDPERRGSDMKGAFERAGYALSGIVHVALAFYALRITTRSAAATGAAPGDAAARDWSATLLAAPAGAMLVGLVAIGLAIVAIVQFTKAWKASFAKELGGDTPLPHRVCLIGRIGYAARGVVFLLSGWFFLRAATAAEADRAGGMGAALRYLQGQEHGAILLGVVAIGLALFGIYSLVESRYRHIHVDLPG